MAYLDKADYKNMIKAHRLDQILDDLENAAPDDVLDDSESEAIAVIRDALVANYDVDNIFGRTGDDRHKNVLRWAKYLVMYFIYDRIPDELVPDRVIKNYDDTMQLLQDIADGKRSVDLPRLQNTDGTTKTKFRWGSQTARSH